LQPFAITEDRLSNKNGRIFRRFLDVKGV